MNELEAIDPRTLGLRLTEARKACGMTQEAAADYLGISRPTFIAIEKGTRRATSEELVKLAARYGRSVHELVRAGAPPVDLEPHLRAVLNESRTSEDVVQAIRELRRFAEDYRQLEELVGAKPVTDYPPEVTLPRTNVIEFAEDVAIRERSRLHLGDQPVLELRQVLESNVGVRIFSSRLPSNIAGMYAYVADLGYCILLNANHPRERRRWTLAHEYGHFLVDRHKPGIDYLGSEGRVPSTERFVDAFAMCFLMPATSVRQQFFSITRSRGDFQVADLCRLSNSFVVSTQAMTLRLESLGLVRKGTWDFLKEQGFQPEMAKRKLRLQRPDHGHEPPYPARYKNLAVLAFCQDQLSEGALARFLRTDRVTAREIVQECLNRSDDIDPDGQPTWLQLPFARSLIAAS
jgi:Zn-dependent peptidase ImmA (M78 family)/DNA-binding XRE family transcriptional regulator